MADVFTLPRIRAADAITDKDGRAVNAFVRFWDTVCRKIEGQEKSQDTILAQLQSQQNQINAQVQRLTKQIISTSHIDGMTFVAEADGATAKITISDHTRVYLDGLVAVDGNVEAGLEYGKAYSIYYDDPDREGGAVDYQATLDPTEAVTSATNPWRHLVGVAVTPATSSDPPVDGGGVRPPGFPPGDLYLEP